MPEVTITNTVLVQLSGALASITQHESMPMRFRFRLVSAVRAVQEALKPAGDVEYAIRERFKLAEGAEVPQDHQLEFVHEMVELGRQEVTVTLPQPWTEEDFQTGCPDVTPTELLGLGPMLKLNNLTEEETNA